MQTAVKSYTDIELINKVKSLNSFTIIPDGYWVLGVRSSEDLYDVYDDKFYIFKGVTFISCMTGTTNSGSWGLKNFDQYTTEGLAQIKADEWYYDVWQRGLHKNKIPALLQVRGFKVIRDLNKNEKSGDSSNWSWEYSKGLNFHTNTYNLLDKVVRWVIGKWSVGCQVSNDVPKYKAFLEMTKPQNRFTYCLINEF